MSDTTTARRVDKLSSASLNRIVEPDRDLPGGVGDAQLIADELLLSVAGLEPGVLSRDQMVTLSREVIAAIAHGGIAFEAVLMAGFSLQIARTGDYTDPRITYLLHEMGEETRHSRLFVRMLDQIGATARNPLDNWFGRHVTDLVIGRIVIHPALLYTMVLAGEEIPDLLQKRAAEHPGTDPFVREVNRYHRQEEARHLAFARMVLPEVWERASVVDRTLVLYVAPLFIREMYENLVHAGVYEVVGLPGMATWRAARRHPERVATRREATRPVLASLVEAGAIEPGRVPVPWRGLCGVDAAGHPVTSDRSRAIR
ncbi:MAG TPA: diiron oxygenase [Acidimicrobiales bacterium]|nr:diiron oxygenase [Acidimicrobiales bacterium]